MKKYIVLILTHSNTFVTSKKSFISFQEAYKEANKIKKIIDVKQVGIATQEIEEKK